MRTKQIIRTALKEIIDEFVREPFYNVREHDYQAALFSKLRAEISASVPVRFAMNPKDHPQHVWASPRTSRVHRESCIGQKGEGGGYVNVDVIVLRDREVVLPCHAHGPTALQETVGVDDVEAAIEIKNAPSMNNGEAKKFVLDVTRLAKLQKRMPDLLCFSLVIDQSISLPHARSDKAWVRDWLAMVGELRRCDDEPGAPFVEVWFVDPKTHEARATYFSSRSSS